MSFRKKNLMKDSMRPIEQLQKAYMNKDESDSCQESIDGLAFGFLKTTVGKGKVYWKR
jgi:hypothetical protein